MTAHQAGGSPIQWLLVLLVLGLHFVFRPILVEWSYGPDLLAGGLLLAALQLRAGWAAGVGFTLGLIEGSMALTALGPHMVVLTLAGFGAARARDLLFSDSPTFLPVFLVIGVWVIDVAVAATIAWPPTVLFVLLRAPIVALGTAIVCWIAGRATGYFLR